MRSVYSTKRWVSAGVVATTLALGAPAAPVFAQIPSNGVIYACMFMDSDGDSAWLSRLVAASEPCGRYEMRVQWSVAGPKGDKGDAGATGMPGAPGLAGAAGLNGVSGAAGMPGAPGVAGPKGDKGDAGATGMPGAPGLAGAAGLNGVSGAAGMPGAPGIAGPAGSQGLPGVQGVIGPNGATGATGAAGAAGTAGAAGSIGATGATGATGETGPTGAKGDKGDQGVVGAQGDQGRIGPTGETGPASGVSVTGQIVDRAIPNLTGLVAYVPGHAFTVITGADGRFTFDVVPPGLYTIAVARNGVQLGTFPNVADVAQAFVDVGPLTLTVCGSNEVLSNGQCVYLDGSGGACDPGFSLVPQDILATIAPLFAGLNYKHTVASNCCIINQDVTENWGLNSNTGGHCGKAGPFNASEPLLGGGGCTNVTGRAAGQLTLCGK